MRKFLVLCLAALFARGALAVSADQLLEPDQAFRLSARAVDRQTVEVDYAIAAGYYLYRERFRFSAEPGTVALGAARFPHGEIHSDPFFGAQEIYRDALRILLPVEASGAQDFKLQITSQGCADVGVCYPPQTRSIPIHLAAAPATANFSPVPPPPQIAPPSAPQSDEARFASVLESGGLWAVAAAFFGAGLLLAFTPCVLPMVPILSGIIVGERPRPGRARALLVSLAYVLGMAVTYTAIGVAAGLTGNLLSAALQNPWVLGAFALVFVLLALSMFGMYELRVPWHSRAVRASSRLRGGRFGAAALMGVLSAAIVSPCVAAPLAGALLYISQTRDAVLGGVALFALALGMGAPLVAVGVSEGALLPRAGEWMDTVKKFFGVLLLAVAIWIVSPLVPVAVQMGLWALVLIGSGVFLRALDPLPAGSPGWLKLGKVLGVIALLAGVAEFAGALSGGGDPLQPLAGLVEKRAAAAPPRFEPVHSLAELEANLGNGQPVLLDFYADWCVTCKEMERFTFSDPRVRERLAGMRLLRADVTANGPDDQRLLRRFRLFGPPAILFFDRQGREIERLRVIGYRPPEEFLRTLEAAALP